jgi:hypothetical protein
LAGTWASWGALGRRIRGSRRPRRIRQQYQSGSREALLLPRPLRTARDSFPSCSSSLHERLSRDAAALVAAFTIRSWSRRTVRQTFLPGREYQPGVRLGAAPASISAADISACLPESVSQGSLVTEDPREVSPLSRRGDVVLHKQVSRQLLLGRPISVEGSPSIRSITGRHWLPPSSLPRCLISLLCSGPSLAGRRRGYLVHPLDRSGVGSCLSAGGASSALGDIAAPGPDHVPFWSEPDSIFGSSLFTAFNGTSPGLTCPGLLAPDRRDAGSRRVGSRAHGRSF